VDLGSETTIELELFGLSRGRLLPQLLGQRSGTSSWMMRGVPGGVRSRGAWLEIACAAEIELEKDRREGRGKGREKSQEGGRENEKEKAEGKCEDKVRR